MNRLFINKEWSPLKKLLFMNAASGGGLATGNPLSFVTNVAKNLVSYVCPFTPTQSGTGDPSPTNVRPIYGVSAVNVWQTGKNLYSFNAGRIKQEQTTSSTTRATYHLGIKNCKLTFSAELITGETPTYTQINVGKFSNGQVSGLSSFLMADGLISTRTITYSESEEAVLVLASDSTQNLATCLQKYNIQIELGETATPYTPYTGQSYNITFPAMGKNLLPPTIYNYAYLRQQVEYGASYRAMYCKVPGAGVYRVERNTVSGNRFRIYASVDEPKPGVSLYGIMESDTALALQFTVPEGYNYVFVYLANDGSTITSNIMLSEGETQQTYEPYTNTVYGGSLDVTTGVLTVEWVCADMGALDYTFYAETTTRQSWRCLLTGIKQPVDSNTPVSAISSVFKAVSANAAWPPYTMKNLANNYLGISFDPGAYASDTEVKEALTGQMVVWLLATPYTIQLTPTEIQTLLGDNTIWSDTNGSNTAIYYKKG